MAPILFFAYGNPARGDDALGPQLADTLRVWINSLQLQHEIEILCDFQLHPEHAYDVAGRELVFFADASTDITDPYCWQSIAPRQPAGWLSHACTPESLLWYCYTLLGDNPKNTYLISLRGNTYELGQPLSQTAQQSLALGNQWLQDFVLDYLQQGQLGP